MKIAWAVWPLLLLSNVPSVSSQTRWDVVNTLHIGGQGGWDCVFPNEQRCQAEQKGCFHLLKFDAARVVKASKYCFAKKRR